MASRTVLKEFLMSLGWRVDPTGNKNFIGALTTATKTALKTGAAITGAAGAVEAYVQVFASNMEKLYYASKRTRSAAGEIQALEFGAQKIGVSAEDAREALEGMAQTLRLNPGMRQFLNNIVGHNTEGNDTAKTLIELVQALNTRYPHFIGANIASMFGMDEKTFLMFSREGPRLLAEEEKFRQMQKRAGIDSEKAASAGREYMNSLRDVWSQVVILGQALAIALLPSVQHFIDLLNPLIERFTKWVGLNREALQTRLDHFLEGLVGWLEKIDFDKLFNGLEKTVKEVDKIVTAFGGWKTVGYLVAAMTFAPLISALANVAIALSTISGWLSGPIIAGTVGWFLGKWLSHKFGEQENKVYDRSAGGRGHSPSSAAPSPSAAGTPLGLRQNNPGNLRSWGDAAVQNGFASFRTPQEGLSAMAGNLLAYSRRGLNNIHDIVSTWAPASDKNDTKSYIADVMKKMGASEYQTLNMKDPESLGKLMGAMIGHEQGYNPYGTSALTSAANSRIQLTQSTRIIVQGAGDPAAVGRHVANEQRNLNAELVENLSPKNQ